MNRVKIICLIIFLLPLGTMIGCRDGKCEDGCEGLGCLACSIEGARSSAENEKTFDTAIPINCSKDEYACAKECTPINIDCCIDSFGDEVGSCPEENPFCCEEFDL